MEQDFEINYHTLEENHWWFKARRSYIMSLINGFSRDIKILDIGCSSGVLLSEMVEQGFAVNNLYGVDISEEAIKKCRDKGIINAFSMDAQNINLDEKFDIIIASDCLEHIKNDQEAIRNWSSLLKKDGKLLVFVPAYTFLWSTHDVVNMHFRRYTLKELKGLFGKVDLKVEKSSYWNFFLFVPVCIVRLIGRGFTIKNADAKGDLYQMPGLVNLVITKLLAIENRLLKWIDFPFGVSTFCIAKKANSKN